MCDGVEAAGVSDGCGDGSTDVEEDEEDGGWMIAE